MIKNKKFALIFRLIALVTITLGLINQLGIFHGAIGFSSFIYYTVQSNFLAFIMFAVLIFRPFPRFEMVCLANILVTLIVFWLVLAPTLPRFYLFSYDNFSVHLIAPLLCLANYILFSEKGRLKYKDVYLTCIFPLFYLVFVYVAGFAGYDYGMRLIVLEELSDYLVRGDWVPRRAPYFFLDYSEVGFFVLAYVGGIVAFVLLLGHGFYFIDRKLKKREVK